MHSCENSLQLLLHWFMCVVTVDLYYEDNRSDVQYDPQDYSPLI